jgi:GxxExxY protein
MGQVEPIPAGVEKLASAVVDAAFKVHTELGPGLLEAVYESCLTWELSDRGLSVLRQVVLPVFYAGRELEAGLKLDLLVNGELIVELKAVDKVLPVHKAQLLSYLKLAKKRLGLLINFNVELIRDGIQRVVL